MLTNSYKVSVGPLSVTFHEEWRIEPYIQSLSYLGRDEAYNSVIELTSPDTRSVYSKPSDLITNYPHITYRKPYGTYTEHKFDTLLQAVVFYGLTKHRLPKCYLDEAEKIALNIKENAK